MSEQVPVPVATVQLPQGPQQLQQTQQQQSQQHPQQPKQSQQPPQQSQQLQLPQQPQLSQKLKSQPPQSQPPQSQPLQSQQRKRAHKACLNCRKRKAKCELDLNDSMPGAVCKRCKDEGSLCEIPTVERRGGFTNVLVGKERRRLQELMKSQSSQGLSVPSAGSVDWKTVSTSSLNTSPTSWTECQPVKTKSARSFSMSGSASDPSPPGGILSAVYMDDSLIKVKTPRVESPEDFTAASAPAAFADSGFASSAFLQRKHTVPGQGNTEAPNIISKDTYAHLKRAQIVRDGIIDAEDIPELVSFFFSHMDPFFHPFIPRAYHDIRRLANEPAILVVICTIAAKARLQEAYSEQHRRLWGYCKQVISGLMWECPDDQVQSLIYAVLLLCEWLPGAMYLDSDKNASGLEAIKRYTRICWPLMGQAVRLARYVGLLETDAQAFITLHLSDHLLACRLGCPPMDGHLFDIDAPMPIAASIADRARLDILKIMHLANRMLSGSPNKSTRDIIMSGQHLSLFHMILAQLDKWRSDYSQYTSCVTFRDRVMMCEFHHVPLHKFSLAIILWQERQHQERLGRDFTEHTPDYENFIGLEESRKFVDIAIESAKFMIEHIEDPSNPVNLLYAPIQWILRLLYSGVFLAKTLLISSLHPTKERQKITIRVIRKAVEVMRTSQPGKYDSYCDLLDAICEQVLSGGTAPSSHISALERLQQEYKASKKTQFAADRHQPLSSTNSVHSDTYSNQRAEYLSASTSPIASSSTGTGQVRQDPLAMHNDRTEIPITHEIPTNQPYKSRRLQGFSPPLSPPDRQQWPLDPARSNEPEPELDSDPEQVPLISPDTRRDHDHDVASLEFANNTLDEMESIWDFLGDTNFTELSVSPSAVNSLAL